MFNHYLILDTYIFITSQCIHNVDDYCIARLVERFVEHTPN